MNRAEKYYDKFSSVYDLLSPDWYYRKPRKFAIRSLALEEGSSVLNLPCGTGQNFSYLQHYLNGIGKVVGVDLSSGMLQKAQRKINANGWDNISLFKEDATAIDKSWVKTHLGQEVKFDAILCDLGLSGFPEWRNVIDNLLSLLRPGGRFVIMDWYSGVVRWTGRFISIWRNGWMGFSWRTRLRGGIFLWLGESINRSPIYLLIYVYGEPSLFQMRFCLK